jgi:hypothetical protein
MSSLDSTKPCVGCGRFVMDEIACPDRVLNGEYLCVDCCAITDYLLLEDPIDAHCGAEHHEIVSFDPEEWQAIAKRHGKSRDLSAREAFNDAMVEEWLLELYTAYPDFVGDGLPDVHNVSLTLWDTPGSYGGQRDLLGDVMTNYGDMRDAQTANIMKYLSKNKINNKDWLATRINDRDLVSFSPTIINRRPI